MSEPLVHVVDDDEWYLAALSRLLQLHGLATRTYSSATQFLESLEPGSHGCVIVDLRMPGVSGLELQTKLAASSSPMPLLFLTGQGDIPCSVRAMRSGAVDFLEKRVPAEVLLRSVRIALERDELQSRERARLCELNARFARLTPREREVLKHMVNGQMIKEIAATLGISERTVKLHRTAITQKVGVHATALLARLTQEVGLFGFSLPTPLARIPGNHPLEEVVPLQSRR